MPCKDIKFSSKIKPFKIFEQSEMHWKNWKRRNFHSTTTEDGAYFGKQAQLVGAAALVVNSIFKGELQFFV